jgi:S-adenosylmethionine:tRNA ribosyltransferase-isomerase
MDDLNLYDFSLPKELIASMPRPRGSSRLMCLLKGELKPRHDYFNNLASYLKKNDCLVINNTKVMKARLRVFSSSGKEYELLLANPLSNGNWEALIRTKGLLSAGSYIFLPNQEKITIINKLPQSYEIACDTPLDAYAEQYGELPLPPYFKRPTQAFDYDFYQTVYAKFLGAVAAPTAGLHFTNQHIHNLKEAGIKIAEITLHVGLGTFIPIKSTKISEHQMHSEYFSMSEDCANQLNSTRKQGGRIIAVGTTSMRTIEQVLLWAHEKEQAGFFSCQGHSSLFIKPGFNFLGCHGLITNFHTPRSTLMVLVCAVAGQPRILNAYEEAVAQKYQFFSYGDACFMEVIS